MEAKMKSMELPKKTKKEMKTEMMPVMNGMPKYPWGLNIDLNKDTLKKLPGLKNAKITEKVQIIATAEIVSIHKSERKDGEDDFSMSLQITDMDAQCSDSFDSAFDKASKEK